MTSESDAEFVERMRFCFADDVSYKDIDRYEALARRGAAVQWRPIEEAPKDGTPILIREGGLIITALYRSIYVCKWVCPTGKGWLELDWIKPTHWMPLPPTPAGETND